jgi:hypothetical protein
MPLLKTGVLASTRDLFVRVDNEELETNQGRLDWLQLLAAILAQWQHLVASNKALNLLYRAMRAVLYQRTATAIKMAIHFGTFFCHRFVYFCPGSRWGDMELLVARWRHSVASGVALDMLHWAMCFISQRRTTMAIKMADDGGTC